jgi:hypothetical protein
MYNAGGEQIDQGLVASVESSGGGPYSCTVTTTSDGLDGYGAVLCHHATATTDTYFWGVVRGYPVKLKAGTASIATGTDFMIGVDGAVTTHTTAATATVIGQRQTRVLVGQNIGALADSTITTDTRSGDAMVDFPSFVGAVR